MTTDRSPRDAHCSCELSIFRAILLIWKAENRLMARTHASLQHNAAIELFTINIKLLINAILASTVFTRAKKVPSNGAQPGDRHKSLTLVLLS